jgi:GTP pyrophosphokinase
MKTPAASRVEAAAPIVRLLDAPDDAAAASGVDGGRDTRPADADPVARAREFAAPLLAGRTLPTGEGVLAHAEGSARVLAEIGAAPELRAAVFLVHAADQLGKPEDVLTPLFGESQATLVAHARKLGDLQRAAHGARVDAADKALQTERVRKMLLAFSRDLRVVLLRLASRLQTLRWFAASKSPGAHELAAEAMQVFAPLANRLGIWQIKWELEDLAFRFLDPENYHAIARQLDERRTDREARIVRLRAELEADLASHGLAAEVQGRPKHLYSIWKKMRKKGVAFAGVMDMLALRVIVPDVAGCYAVLARVHERWPAIAGEFDDYIARPKANGYRSLHTVVQGDDGRPVEIQIRTPEMHEHAEYGVSAHWAYKEADLASRRGGAGASGRFEASIAEARLVVLRQLLAWQHDLAEDDSAAPGSTAGAGKATFDDRIYVFTPQATVVELTEGATPIDFAYAVHTDLGHRCRGAKVDGRVVPLATPLSSGQTVEITAAKTGGPSLDWLNPDLGYLRSARSKAKVRAWFNALATDATIARGREAVEKVLQREGKTALKLEDLAAQLGFRSAEALFEVVGKDELSLRSIEALLRPAPEPKADEEEIHFSRPRAEAGGVLVVGVESLLTSLARCCRPAPPDAIAGYVTRGKGVAVHRTGCSNLRELRTRAPERVIPVAWGATDAARPALYPVDVQVEASDRQGLLRDVSEVFAKEKTNVTGVKSSSVKDASGGTAFMTFTVEVADAARLAATLALVCRVSGVRAARRR